MIFVTRQTRQSQIKYKLKLHSPTPSNSNLARSTRVYFRDNCSAFCANVDMESSFFFLLKREHLKVTAVDGAPSFQHLRNIP